MQEAKWEEMGNQRDWFHNPISSSPFLLFLAQPHLIW